MAAGPNIEIKGLKEALKTLNKVDRSMRLQITKDYKEIVKPLVDDIKQEIPLRAPMSGWNREFKGRSGANVLPWKGNERAMVKPYISGKRPRSFRGRTSNLGVFGVRWTAPAATLMDLAQNSSTPSASVMIRTLDERVGRGNPRSRIMYNNWERHQNEINKKMVVLVNRVTERLNKELK